MMREYLRVIFSGILAVFLYNFYASLSAGCGKFSGAADFSGNFSRFKYHTGSGICPGASPGRSGSGRGHGYFPVCFRYWNRYLYACKMPEFRVEREHMKIERQVLGEISQFSFLTCIQQSVMNFGILMVQGLVNSFGTVVMAAFAAAVKIDSFAYMPVQDFGNAFSTFIAQNYGAGKKDRIRAGIRSAVTVSVLFCLFISFVVCVFAKPLLLIFVQPHETEILKVGMSYLRIEVRLLWDRLSVFALCLYRAVRRPGMSVVLTVISLGTG